ncbi:TRAP transporter small permease [Mesobacterium pallidum]|uniref:TRAP transporter small permease n=1 Tax=Mesobacterium pallidum TaxID=2872037 RepID=UPI001EE379CE|nr:TRAP transporter small permease [Mesobacterium pallidum]
MYRTLDKIAEGLTSLSALIGTIGLLGLVGVIMVDVVGRYFGQPLTGAQDITQMGLVLIVFGGMALCDRMGGHIAVDLFERSFPHWVIRLGDIATALLGAVIFATIAWHVWESSKLSLMLNLKTNIIYLPKAWFQWFVVGASTLTAFGMLVRLLALLTGRMDHQEHEGLTEL